MKRPELARGMKLLSGAFDRGPAGYLSPDQVAARTEAYYEVLCRFDQDVWEEAVTWMVAHRAAAVLSDGRRVDPGFPLPAECIDVCQQIAAKYTARLPPPEVTPAPPEVASRWIARIKRIASAGRGPLSRDLGSAADPTEWNAQTARSLARRITQERERL